MATQQVRGLIVAGCGDFGSQVLDTLAERNRLPLRSVESLRLLGRGASRRLGAEQFAAQAERFQSELQVAFHRHPGAAFALVFAADEAVGSGLALAALDWLGRGEQRPTVWIALPPAGATAAVGTRTYATLLELESLRRQSRLGYCCLRQGQEEPAGAAARFAGALLVNLPPASPMGYGGFGIGIYVHARAFWSEHLARSLVRRELAQLAQPSEATGGDDLAGRWAALWQPLLAPVQGTALWNESWSMIERKLSGYHSDELRLPDLLESQAAFYRRPFDWTAKVNRHWEATVNSVTEQLWAACNKQFAGAASPGLAALNAAVARAARTLEAALERCTASEESLAGQAGDLRKGLTVRSGGLLGRRRTQDDAAQLYRLDELLVQERWERHRRDALTRVREHLGEVYREFSGKLTAEGNRVQSWLAALQHVPPLEEPGTAHVLVASLPPGAADRLLQRIYGDSLRRRLAEPPPSAAERAAELLLRAARDDIRRATVPFEWPEPEAEQGSRWAQAALPTLPTLPPLAVQPVVSSALPAALRRELERQARQTAQVVPIPWFEHEDLAFTSTVEVALSALADLPGWHAAYAGSEGANRPGLHALHEPPGGWPELAPVPAARPPAPAPDRSTLVLSASVLLHALGLGLVTSIGNGACAARYLSPDGQSLILRPLGSLAEALQALTLDTEMRLVLQELTDRWLTTLDLERVAALTALLAWYEERLFSPQPGAPDSPEFALLREACRQDARALETRLAATGAEWPQRCRALRSAIGTAADDCSLPAGDWRYLQW